MHGYTLGLLHGLAQEVYFSQHDVYGATEVPELVTSVQLLRITVFKRT